MAEERDARGMFNPSPRSLERLEGERRPVRARIREQAHDMTRPPTLEPTHVRMRDTDGARHFAQARDTVAV